MEYKNLSKRNQFVSTVIKCQASIGKSECLNLCRAQRRFSYGPDNIYMNWALSALSETIYATLFS